MADLNHTTKLSRLIRDPFVAEVFARAEDDGTDPAFAETDHPPCLDSGPAEVIPATGRRVLVEV